MRYVPVRPPRTELGNPDRGAVSNFAHRPAARAPMSGCGIPRSKTTCKTNANASRGTRILHNPHSRHISDLEQTSQTGENARRDRVLAHHSLALSLNFTQLPVPYSPVHRYTHGHDRVSKVNDSGRACRCRRRSHLCFPLAHRFVIGSSIGSLLCFPLAKAE